MKTFGPPSFQLTRSWGSILGTLGGLASFAIPGVGPALGSAILAAGSSVGQGIDSMNAEKKAAKQQQQGATNASAALSPYNTLGLQSANTLAGLLGLPGLPGGAGGAGGGSSVPLYQQANRATPTTMQGTMTPAPESTGQAMPRRGATLASVRTRAAQPRTSSYANAAGSRF